MSAKSPESESVAAGSFRTGTNTRAPLLLSSLLCGLFLLLLTAGCYSPAKKVAQNMRDLQLQWQTNVIHQLALPEQTLNWPQALAQLESGNLKLRRGRADITNAHENTRQVIKDLMPTINLRSGVSKSIESLPATSFDDVTFNVDSFFNIPGFVSLSTRLFAAKLVTIRTETFYELSWREQTIELYKLFLSFEDVAATEAQLRRQLSLAQAISRVDVLAGEILLRDATNRFVALEKERIGLQDKAGDLFGNRDFRWRLVSEQMPELRYDSEPLELTDTNRVAQVQMKLAAIEFVAAWARIKGIQLQYWPELTLFITGPPVYQRNAGGNESFWDAGKIRANANFFWRLDTRGQIANQLRQTRRDQELQLTRLRQDALALIDKILAAQKLMGTLREQADQLNQLLPLLSQVPPASDYTGILKATEAAQTLRDQERKLRRDLAELNTLFWFVDETKWARHN